MKTGRILRGFFIKPKMYMYVCLFFIFFPKQGLTVYPWLVWKWLNGYIDQASPELIDICLTSESWD